MNNNLRYGFHRRKSTDTDDKQVASLEDQEKVIVDLAKRNDLNIVETYTESISGTRIDRPVFNQLVKDIKKGKINALLCWKVDRLARNFIDGGALMHLLVTGELKEIRTSVRTYYPTDNVLMLAIDFGIAAQTSKDIKENVTRRIQLKFEGGDHTGRAPFGYLNIKGKIPVDSHRAPFVKRMFDIYVNERKSYKEISEILYLEGLRTTSGRKVFKSTIQKIITNPIYIGIIERGGVLKEGHHTPLISKHIFDQAQEIASNRSRPRPKSLFFPLRGFLKCASCGCSLTATIKKGHHYYYCTNGKGLCVQHKKYSREVVLYPMCAKVLEKLAFDSRLIDIVYKGAKQRTEGSDEHERTTLDRLQKALQSSTDKEGRLLDTFLAMSIDKDVFDQKSIDIKNEKTLLKLEIKRLEESKPQSTLEPVKKIFEQGITMRNEFLTGTDEKKFQILTRVLWNLEIKDGNIVTIQYKSAYQLLADSPKKLSFSQMLGYKDSNLDTQDQNLMSYH